MIPYHFFLEGWFVANLEGWKVGKLYQSFKLLSNLQTFSPGHEESVPLR
jgi:hypothetical protein